MQSWICIARLKAQQTCQGPVILRIAPRPVKEVCVTIHGQSFKSISNQLKFKNKRWSCSNHNLRRLGCGVPPTPMSARSPQAHITTLHLVVETWSVQRGRLFSIQYTHVYTLVQFAKWESNTIKHPLIPNTYTYIILYYISIIIHYFSKIYHYPFVDALIGARIANAQKTSNGIFQLATVPPSGRQLKFKQRKACEPTSPGKLAHYQSLSHCPPGYSIPQHFGSLDQYWKGTFRDVLRVFFFFLDLWVSLLVEQVSAAVRPGLVNVSRGFSPLGSVGPRGRSHHLWTPSHCWLQLPWVRSVLKPWSHNFPPLCIELCNFSILKSQQWKVQMSHFSWLSPVPNPSKVLTTPGSSIAMRYTRTCPATGLKHMINQSKLASVLPLCPWDPTK